MTAGVAGAADCGFNPKSGLAIPLPSRLCPRTEATPLGGVAVSASDTRMPAAQIPMAMRRAARIRNLSPFPLAADLRLMAKVGARD